MELTCPQCRGSMANMQLQSRLKCLSAFIGCSEEAAMAVIAYENLLTEVIHLCECEEDGLPYFTSPVGAVSRVMARDELCDIVDDEQGHGEGTRLRRMLRGENFADAFVLALEGYVKVMRQVVSSPGAVAPFLERIQQDVSTIAAERSPRAGRVGHVLPGVLRVVAASGDAERATSARRSGQRARGERASSGLRKARHRLR